MDLSSYKKVWIRRASIVLFITLGVVMATYYITALAAETKPSNSAKKSLKQAERILKTPSNAEEGRKYILDALKDSVLASDPNTYIVAGKIEAALFNENIKKLSINRNDPSVDRVRMADELLGARNYYLKAFSLDSLTTEKKRLKKSEISAAKEWIAEQMPHFYNSGIAYLNKKMYYPKAYDAFMAYAEMPDSGDNVNTTHKMNDSVRANAYFYAGVMAFNSNEYKTSAQAFELARQLRYPRKEVLINEMVCYRRLADADSSYLPQAMISITEISKEGIDKYGVHPPLFVQKYIAGCIWNNSYEASLSCIDSLLTKYPGSTSLLMALRGETLYAMGDTVGAIEDYRMASTDSLANFQTLLTTSKLFARKGISELSKITGSGRYAKKQSRLVKDTWLKNALEYAERAKQTPRKREGIFGDLSEDAYNEMLEDLENTLTTIQYYMIQ